MIRVKMRVILISLGLFLCICIASCSSPPEKQRFAEDVDWNGQIVGPSNIEMKTQAAHAANVLEDRLKQLLMEFKAKLDQEAQSLLDKSQAAWLEYAKAKAEFSADRYRGGTHRGLEYTYVYISLLRKRIMEVKRMRINYHDFP